jgi:hypothetical protein
LATIRMMVHRTVYHNLQLAFVLNGISTFEISLGAASQLQTPTS